MVNSAMETYVKADNIEAAALSMIQDYCLGSVPHIKLMNGELLSRKDLRWRADEVGLNDADIGLWKVDNRTKLQELSTAWDANSLNKLKEGGSCYIDQFTNKIYQRESDLFSNNTVTTESSIYYKSSAVREYMGINDSVRDDMASILTLPKYNHDIFDLQRKLVSDGLFDPYSLHLIMIMSYNIVRSVNIKGNFSWVGADILSAFKAIYDREIDEEVEKKLQADADAVNSASSYALRTCMEGLDKPDLSLV